MKNLELLEISTESPPFLAHGSGNFAFSSPNIYYTNNNSLYRYDESADVSRELVPLLLTSVISVKCLTIEKEVICVAGDSNCVIITTDYPHDEHTVDFGAEIAAISWNPTEEIVAVVTPTGDVHTFSLDYFNGKIFPKGSSHVENAIPETVYVGWGSKDTQFRGSEGKLKPTSPVKVEPVQDRKPTISWRGNGEMFVVNYWKEDVRKFVVFEFPCKALYRSEECPGLQAPIAWRPAGNMIATIAKRDDALSVVVFEKNGQKRFDFQPDLGQIEISDLKWSPCAQILALRGRSGSVDSIHLLTCSNYRWCEKQNLRFNPDNPLVEFEWVASTQFTYILRVVTSTEIVTYIFRNVISSNASSVAVINGKKLELTDFKSAIVPPSLCSKSIQIERSINFVQIQDGDDGKIVLVDSANVLRVYNWPGLEEMGKIDFGSGKFPLYFHHFTWIDPTCLYFAKTEPLETIIDGVNVTTGQIRFVGFVPGSIRHAIAGSTNPGTGWQRIDDRFSICYDQETVRQSSVVFEDRRVDCRLTSNCRFYVNETKIGDSVNSFVIFDGYLLFTTKLNELHCCRLIEIEDLAKGRNYRRTVEQGATIVAAIPGTPNVVLQMPRGNIETISCRSISIDILDGLLDGNRWRDALYFVRTEKLNSNLLVDLNPNRFLTNIPDFVTSFDSVNELNRTCLEICNDNVLVSVYPNCRTSGGEFAGKTGKIFEKMLEFFDQIDYLPYVTTIIIINLHFFTLKNALVYVQDLLRRCDDEKKLEKNLTEAINTLKIYGAEEKLYDEALLLYDLKLARHVAGCCQMDPRVYEPQLDTLKNLSEIERRYEINVAAKRPQIAIRYLLRNPNATPDQIESFLTVNRVSRDAYETCAATNPHFLVVSRALATDLSREGHHREAGVILKRADLFEEALEEFREGLRWRETVNLMTRLDWNEAEKLRIVGEMATKLMERKDVGEAAILYERYANNYEMAVKVLVDNCRFEEAVHVANKHGRPDILVADIILALLNHRAYLTEKLSELHQLFTRHRTRLVHVRQNRVAKFNFGCDADDRDDLFSDAGSVVSTRSSRSRSSTASSRNRRKEARKKQDLREGGVYEDIALVRALHGVIEEIGSKKREVEDCCVLLLQESKLKYDEIKDLHVLYRTIEDDVKKSIIDIWPPHFYLNNPTQDVKEIADLENLEQLDLEFRTPPKIELNWNLKLFQNL